VVRVSPDGNLLCLETFNGAILETRLDLLTRSGAVRRLASVPFIAGLVAWTPDGREVWFSETNLEAASVFWAMDVKSGRLREVARLGGSWVLLDVGRGGKVLARLVSNRFSNILGRDGEQERNLSWFDRSILVDLSARGDTVLIGEHGGRPAAGTGRNSGGSRRSPSLFGAKSEIYLRRSD